MPCSGMKSSPAALGGATGCVLIGLLLWLSKSSFHDCAVGYHLSMPMRCVRVRLHLAMDEIDRQIVALLRQDARRSFQSIGMRVSLSAPAVKRRVDRLEADGVVRGYTALVDPGRFGWGPHAFVALYSEGRMAAAGVAEARQHPPQ